MPAWSPPSACRVVSRRRSVIFDIAETTATTGRRALSTAISSHAAFMRSAEPTLVPPNFITSRPAVCPLLSSAHNGPSACALFLSSAHNGPSACALLVFFSIGDACSYQLQNFLFHLLRRQAGRVKVNGVRSLYEGRFCSVRIALVALGNLSCKVFSRNIGLFTCAPAHSLQRIGVQK